MGEHHTHFELHPRLAADTAFVCDLAACRVLLMDDARYAWCVVVMYYQCRCHMHFCMSGYRALVRYEFQPAGECWCR